MKDHFFKGILEGFAKHAEGGYESEDADTVFGEKPGVGCPPTAAKPGMAKPGMPAKSGMGKPAGKPKPKKPQDKKEGMPKAPGPHEAQGRLQ